MTDLPNDEIVELAKFTVDGLTFALPLQSVKRVVSMVAITPLPTAPEIIAGIIGVTGDVVPVVNLRRRFKCAERKPAVEDRLLLVHSRRRLLALWVDDVAGIVTIPRKHVVAAAQLGTGIEQVQGVVVLDDGLVLIHDLDQCLSPEDEQRLHLAMPEGLPI